MSEYKKKLVILSGAGMSAESGISTFRDSNGLWEKHRIEDVATPETICAPKVTRCDRILCGLARIFPYRLQ